MSEILTTYATSPEALQAALATLLGDRAESITVERDEVTLTVNSVHYFDVMQRLRDDPVARFEQLMDL